MEFWFYNQGWDIIGHVLDERQAVKLADKDHLIVFQENAQTLFEAGLY